VRTFRRLVAKARAKMRGRKSQATFDFDKIANEDVFLWFCWDLYYYTATGLVCDYNTNNTTKISSPSPSPKNLFNSSLFYSNVCFYNSYARIALRLAYSHDWLRASNSKSNKNWTEAVGSRGLLLAEDINEDEWGWGTWARRHGTNGRWMGNFSCEKFISVQVKRKLL